MLTQEICFKVENKTFISLKFLEVNTNHGTLISAYTWNYFPHLQKSVDSNASFIKILSASWINSKLLKLLLAVPPFLQMQDFIGIQYRKITLKIIALITICCGRQSLLKHLCFCHCHFYPFTWKSYSTTCKIINEAI
jgi:hypothetical protein